MFPQANGFGLDPTAEYETGPTPPKTKKRKEKRE